MVIKRIGVMSLAKISALIYAGIGLLIGLLYALFAVIGGGAMLASGAGSEAGIGGGMLIVIGLVAVVAAPVFYGLIGFVGGALSAWLFNLASGYVGGLEVDAQ